MKISLKWVQEYCKIPDLPDNLQAFCDKLDLTGTGVENIEKIGANFDNIVTAKVISKEPHPDSDHMFVTMVDVGDDEPLQIVCGAQNFNEGDHIVTAKIGAVLPGNFKIKKSKLRGVNSCGMNCSEEELGLADSSEGIMILSKDAPVGVPIADYLGIGDTVIDTEITPNRPDCLSVVGCAREIAAIYNSEFKNPLSEMAAKIKDCSVCDMSKEKAGNIAHMPIVNVDDPDRCPRYTARLISGVKVGPSPKWLVTKLNSMGARSINNIVDITNYILYLYGQPLHAFDADTLLEGGDTPHIVVRPARDGEEFTTLDEEERCLNSDMTVISTQNKAVALAGVMGGLDSEVTDATTNILLETATFSPAHTSRTSRALDLISESSMRYERRVDDVDIDKISDAACALIVEVAGGKICSDDNEPGEKSIVDVYSLQTQPNNLQFRMPRFNNMMGVDIDIDFAIAALTNLGCDVKIAESTESAQVLNVKTPTYRPDLEREIDLYEEVIRLYGLDKIKSTLPRSAKRVGHVTGSQKILNIINNTMCASGVTETVTYSFAHENDLDIFGGAKNTAIGFSQPVVLINPMSADESTMRQTILPGLLRSVSYNLNHGVDNIKLYETGVVFNIEGESGKPTERQKLACVLCGSSDVSWNDKQHAYDFFDIKGVCENLLATLNIAKVRFVTVEEGEAPHLHPGRSAYVYSGKNRLGWIGEIHPDLCDKYEIDKTVAAFELDINLLSQCIKKSNEFKDVPIFPGVSIDIAIVVDDDVSAETCMQRIKSAGGNLLSKVELFDVYKNDEHVGAGKKSLAFKLLYVSDKGTLTKENVEKVHNKLLDKVCRNLNAEIRS